MTAQALRNLAAQHLAIVLDGTTEGAIRGWETRREQGFYKAEKNIAKTKAYRESVSAGRREDARLKTMSPAEQDVYFEDLARRQAADDSARAHRAVTEMHAREKRHALLRRAAKHREAAKRTGTPAPLKIAASASGEFRMNADQLRQLATVHRARVHLGDTPGHPFRGNQWASDSQSAGPPGVGSKLQAPWSDRYKAGKPAAPGRTPSGNVIVPSQGPESGPLPKGEVTRPLGPATMAPPWSAKYKYAKRGAEKLRALADEHRTMSLTGHTEGAHKGWATRRNGDGGVSDAASSHAHITTQRAQLTAATSKDPEAIRAAHLKARSAHRAAALAHAKAGNTQKATEHRQQADAHWASGKPMALQLDGTTEGAIKGWETRKGGGDPKADPPEWHRGRYERFGGEEMVTITRIVPTGDTPKLGPLSVVHIGEKPSHETGPAITTQVPARELIRVDADKPMYQGGKARWVPPGQDPSLTKFMTGG